MVTFCTEPSKIRKTTSSINHNPQQNSNLIMPFLVQNDNETIDEHQSTSGNKTKLALPKNAVRVPQMHKALFLWLCDKIKGKPFADWRLGMCPTRNIKRNVNEGTRETCEKKPQRKERKRKKKRFEIRIWDPVSGGRRGGSYWGRGGAPRQLTKKINNVSQQRKQPLIFALRRHKRLKPAITLSLEHKYSESHSTELRTEEHTYCFSFTTATWRDPPPAAPPRYTSCGVLPENDERSDILDAGNSVEHFGISLRTRGLTKKSSTSRRNNSTRGKQKLKWAERIQTLYSGTEQCNRIWWQIIIEFAL